MDAATRALGRKTNGTCNVNSDGAEGDKMAWARTLMIKNVQSILSFKRRGRKCSNGRDYIKVFLHVKAHLSHLFVDKAVQNGDQQALKHNREFSLFMSPAIKLLSSHRSDLL